RLSLSWTTSFLWWLHETTSFKDSDNGISGGLGGVHGPDGPDGLQVRHLGVEDGVDLCRGVGEAGGLSPHEHEVDGLGPTDDHRAVTLGAVAVRRHALEPEVLQMPVDDLTDIVGRQLGRHIVTDVAAHPVHGFVEVEDGAGGLATE